MASSSHSQPRAQPYAIALLFHPSIESAIEAGVPLPKSRLSVDVPIDKAVELGVLLPLSAIHIDAVTGLPLNSTHPDGNDSSPRNHKSVPLPASVYPAATEIHPKYYQLAHSFVRIQDYIPGVTIVPPPPPGQSTAGILYASGTVCIKPGDTLEKFRSIRVSTVPGLRRALSREGPLLVEVNELQAVEEAPEVVQLIEAKIEVGWACRPDLKTLKSLATIATKLTELEDPLLPQLRQNPGDRTTGNKVKRRLRVIKDNAARVRNKVQADVISPALCTTITRALQKVQAKVPKKPHAYLVNRVDLFLQLVRADLRRGIRFV